MNICKTVKLMPTILKYSRAPTIILFVWSSVQGGRIECTMQNVADMLVNRRSSTISSEEHGSRLNHLFSLQVSTVAL